jgi:DNA-binding Xre family transcriptional regulator
LIRLRISEVAKSKGLNQSQLQIKAGVTPQLLNRYWHSHTQSVAFEPLEKIAIALGVNPGDLLASDEVIAEGTKGVDSGAA